MARFMIISKDGRQVRYEGKPRYSGIYLKPSFIEFSEIASPVPIEWQVGDYVDYSRTGLRYRLYSIPQAAKNARKGSHGRAFTYSNVQFHAATKELEIALFKDLVTADNKIHFSTNPDVVSFENVYGIVRRIQACMDYFFPNRWLIKVEDFDTVADADVIERINTAKDFALSGGTCLDALSKIYELWEIGWMHSHENGKEVITIGYSSKRIDEKTMVPYLYGKGNGLTAIKKSQTNKDEFATRLYVYGSERNIPARYYNGKDILNADSVDIRHLMLPLDRWGKTAGLPDARKAYLENEEAVAKYGLIPKTHYFDSDDAGADIYPTIEGMTAGIMRKVLSDMDQTKYSPSEKIYADSARLDEVLSVSNPSDDGIIKKNGQEYEETQSADISALTETISIPASTTAPYYRNTTIASVVFRRSGMGEVTIKPDINFILLGEGIESVDAKFELCDAESEKLQTTRSIKESMGTKLDEMTWVIAIPSMSLDFTRKEQDTFPVFMKMMLTVRPESGPAREVKLIAPEAPLSFNFARKLASTFTIKLKQIGFDINERASQGEGKRISMKSGMCEGRDFQIKDCTYDKASDTWSLVCKRQKDDSLGVMFPYSLYKIQSGDKFVLLDMALPESYILVQQERLLSEGEKLLAKASKVQSHYEPSIDAKVMIESGRKLREGMFMEIEDEDVVDGTTDYILIDTLNIYEDEDVIPTYKVTLREKRKVSYKGSPSATTVSNTKSAEDTETVNASVDLTGYATEKFVEEKIGEMFYWADEDKKTIGTKYNFFSEGENAAGGPGEESEGVSGGGIVDTQMSDTSDNAIANRTVKQYIDKTDAALMERIAALELGGGGGGSGENPSGEGDKNYYHTQGVPAEEWIIEHNLGKYPSVTVISSAGEEIYCDKRFPSMNKVVLNFGTAISGAAFLN